MSKLMSVLGIVLLAVGAALALVGLVNPAQMQINGLTLEVAAILVTGGILAIGLGGVIAALQGQPASVTATTAAPVYLEEAIPVPEVPVVAKVEPVVAEKLEEVAAPPPPPPPAASEQPRIRFNPFTRKPVDVAAAAATTAAAATAAVATTTAAAAVETSKSAVDDTIAALEQAKADIANAVGGVSTLGEEKIEETVPEVEEVVEEANDTLEEGELYVLEEREIRGRPARILSDQTVEAETDEGWMRFENLEHLNEYLDAMGEPA